MVPKERLDEVLAHTRALQEQVQTMQYLLRERAPAQSQQVDVKEPEELARLKEENPTVYKYIKETESKVRRQSATQFTLLDKADRAEFLQEFGDVAKEKMRDVEAKLQELRANGIHHFNRGQILLNILGQETVEGKRKPRAATPTAQTSAPVQNEAPSNFADVPSSNPAAAGVVKGSAPATTNAPPSLEELEERLKDVVF
jgi:hypothetical protein